MCLELNVVEFAEAHARELAAMEQAVRATHGNNLVTQRVPRHMRRRAAAYDIRRLPRRLREQAKKEAGTTMSIYFQIHVTSIQATCACNTSDD